jgi:hypothetical protein
MVAALLGGVPSWTCAGILFHLPSKVPHIRGTEECRLSVTISIYGMGLNYSRLSEDFNRAEGGVRAIAHEVLPNHFELLAAVPELLSITELRAIAREVLPFHFELLTTKLVFRPIQKIHAIPNIKKANRYNKAVGSTY